jgi:two-component system, LytTR family, sensor kinase
MIQQLKAAWAVCQKYQIDTFLLMLVLSTSWWVALEKDALNNIGASFASGVYVSLIIALNSYLINDLYLKKYLYAKKYWQFMFVSIATIVAVVTLFRLLNLWYHKGFTGHIMGGFEDIGDFVFTIYVMPFFVTCISTGIRVVKDQIKIRKDMETLEKERTKAELEYLKAQINPHFVFNYLNTIYFQIHKENQTARQTLMTFSELLRYQLYECNVEKINVEKEMTYLTHYVDLQRLRYSENYKIDLNIDPSVSSFDIPPLLIMPFVENGFKYMSSHTDRLNILKISLVREGDFLKLTVFNTKDNFEQKEVVKQGGIGLKNVKRRLELLNTEGSDFMVNEMVDTYEVVLKLRVSKY